MRPHLDKKSARRTVSAELSRGSRDASGIAAIEFALIFPIVLLLVGLTLFASEGISIQRSVSLTAHTITDLTTRQASVNSTDPYPISSILGAASNVMTPYGSSALSMTVSEIQTNGTTSATVIWSQPAFNGVALAPGSVVTIPPSLATPSYLIMGTVSYSYNPLSIMVPESAIPLTDTIFMAPRVSSSIACCS